MENWTIERKDPNYFRVEVSETEFGRGREKLGMGKLQIMS